MKVKVLTVVVIAMTMLTGCSVPWLAPLKEGEGVPQDKVLVIGKFVLEPPLEPQEKGLTDVIRLGINKTIEKKVMTAGIPSIPDEAMDTQLYEFFYFPMTPGQRYIRTGQVMKYIKNGFVGGMGSAPVTRWSAVNLMKNIRFQIPADAKAVYIGTIVYNHDGKQAKSVSVEDEYAKLTKELSRKKIPGIVPSDIAKRLAQEIP